MIAPSVHRRCRPRAAVVAVWSLLVLSTGCRATLPPLAGSEASAEALARAVLAGVAAGDRGALERLRLTRDEFETHVWPHLPVSRPETNMPMAFVWNRLSQGSEGRLAQVLARHGGTRYEFVSIAFRGERSTYGHVEVWRDSVITVRTPSGDLEELELFGSMITQEGRAKVFSYVTD